MDAINSLPIKAPVVPAQKPRAEAASGHGSQNSSFENLLDEKSAPAGEQAACAGKAPRPDEPAKSADATDVPDTADFSMLLAMFPVLPILPTLPLQPEAIAPAALPDAGTPASGLPPQTATATASFFAPAVAPPTATPLAEVLHQANGAAVAPDANAQTTFGNEIPQTAAVVTLAPPPTVAPTAESFAEAVPMAVPAAKVSEMIVVVTAAQMRRELRGTDVAMQERVMPDPLKPQAPASKTAVPAADSSARESVVAAVAPQAEIRVPASTGQHTAGEHREEKPGFQPQPDAAPAPTPTFTNSFVAPTAPGDEPAAVVRTQTETIVHRTVDAAERLRATGSERVEVQIKLDAGPALTVRLQLIHGEVKPIFLTDSHELRQAIEQNWSQFAERGADRNVRVTTPVFASPNSQSGMNDLNQQQREGRQRAFAEAQEAASGGKNPTGRPVPRRTNAVAPATASTAGVQLYA